MKVLWWDIVKVGPMVDRKGFLMVASMAVMKDMRMGTQMVATMVGLKVGLLDPLTAEQMVHRTERQKAEKTAPLTAEKWAVERADLLGSHLVVLLVDNWEQSKE